MFPNSKFQIPNSKGGQAIFIAVMFFLAGSFIIVSGITAPVLRDIQNARTLELSKKSYYYSEGVLEDVIYRLKFGKPVSDTEALVFDNGSATVTITPLIGAYNLLSRGNREERIRTNYTTLVEGVGAAFFYGVQSDDGGIDLINQSKVLGNAFSNGPITGAGNTIGGDVISTEADGLIDDIHATGTAHSHTIQDSIVDKDAYYQTISNTTVSGTEFPDSPDQPRTELPIPDATIEQWEADAEAGGVIASSDPECSGGTYTINEDITLGPVKIECDVVIKSFPTVSLGGAVWVVGDITIQNGPTIGIDPLLGNTSVPFIADDTGDRLGSGIITMKNTATFEGNGDRSFVLMVSYNTSNENGGSVKAIEVENIVSGALLVYAAHGEIVLKNSIQLSEVSGYKISLQNTAEVTYESGLKNLLFTSGPSGGYVVDSWTETE